MASNHMCHIRFLHAVPNVPAVDIYINNVSAAKSIDYREFTQYSQADPGIYAVQIFATGKKDIPLLHETIELIENTIYTMAFVGLSGNLTAELIPDRKTHIDSGKAYARFINVSPYNTDFDISLNDKSLETGLRYGEISGYTSMPPNNYYLRANDSRTGELKLEVPKMLLKAGKKYAIYIIGIDSGTPGLQILVPLEGSTYI